ncbi:unnamed protein product [Polarella glacialis]|uniref:Uncharacterized protein n=2 Tax=Polarella glacialis TaxID=89957 RepID=A0A813JV97_POLGL|nr:unnamed protein product [Polarella glacialis]
MTSMTSSMMRSFAGSLSSFGLPQDMLLASEPDMAPPEMPHLACTTMTTMALADMRNNNDNDSNNKHQILEPAALVAGLLHLHLQQQQQQQLSSAPNSSALRGGSILPLPPLATVVEGQGQSFSKSSSGRSSSSPSRMSTGLSSQGGPTVQGLQSQGRCCSCWWRVYGIVRKIIRNALVPPVIGAALGMTVALIGPLRLLFVDVSGSEDATFLSFAFKGLKIIGGASVPVNMLVLGSNLAKGCNFKAVPLSTNLGIIFTKTIGLPVVMALLIGVISRSRPATDPAVWLVAIVVSCTPTANNIMVMVELSGQHKESMTTSIFSQYLAAPFTLTLVLTTYMMLLQTSWYLGS